MKISFAWFDHLAWFCIDALSAAAAGKEQLLELTETTRFKILLGENAPKSSFC